MSQKKYVIGHRNPDIDSVASAIVYASYLQKKKEKVTSAVVGEIKKETIVILDKFKEKYPLSIKNHKKNCKYYLVDHNSLEQSLPGIKQEDIIGFVDHHQLAGIKTLEPIFCRCEPLGSTSTIIYKMFNESNFKLTKNQAGLIISGIISDTLKFTSPTTTKQDKEIAFLLSKDYNIDINKLAQDIFKVKSDISGKKTKNIVLDDYKEYNFTKAKIGFGTHETTCVTAVNEIKDRLFKEIIKIKKQKSIDLIFFTVIDIFKKECYLYLVSEKETEIAKKAFEFKEIKDNVMIIPGVTSRKKQIIPPLFKILN